MGKKNKIGKVIQSAAMFVLFVLIIIMMSYINDIQGTARVVNYAGLVRGATQRMVKLEIAGIADDAKIEELDCYLAGIGNGSEVLGLIYVEDAKYQARIADLNRVWKALKKEIYKVRQDGYANTDIVNISEVYFGIADDVVGLAENYSESCAKKIRNLEIAIIILIIILTAQLLQYAWQAAQMLKANSRLKKEVYLDRQTGLPNKAKCLELLEAEDLLTEPTCVFMFDLNNLKYVNDNFGHETGDALILTFALMLRENIPEKYFVGRYGGDEFIAIVTGEDSLLPTNIAHTVQDSITLYNASGADIPISYAVGYAGTDENPNATMKLLLAEADRYMYINKKETKDDAHEAKKKMQESLMRLIIALGNEYKECCYYNLNTGNYQKLNNKESSVISNEGNFLQNAEKLMRGAVDDVTCAYILKRLSHKYMRKQLSPTKPSYEIVFSATKNKEIFWWRIMVMYVNCDEKGELTHVLVAAQEITGEKKLEYEAKHDAMTGLWNKTTAYIMVEELAGKEPNGYQAMLVCDIDNFKQVNDKFGHIVGDDAIKAVAASLQDVFYSYDCVAARFGGDEFMVYLDKVESIAELENMADRLLQKIKNRAVHTAYVNVTVSVGIAVSSKATELDTLFQYADKALYEAKNLGKNRFVLQVIDCCMC